ncbi:MAG: MFS transporter [Oscillospiraceae bacterium]|nr:MFS transporter [Oscillospiraceae bacterium]
MRIPKQYAMVWLAVCGMIGASLSLKNLAGLFFTPMEETFGVGRGAVSLTLTVNNLLLAAGEYVSPRIIRGDNFRVLTRACALCAVGATLLMGWAPNLAVMYALCALRGFASGMLCIVLGTVVINNWFVRGNSIVTGVAMAAGGIGSALLSPLLARVIETAGWRAGYRAEALVGLALYAPLILLPVALRPEDRALTPLGGARVQTEDAPGAETAEAQRGGWRLPGVLLLVVSANAVSVFSSHMPGVAASFALSASVGAAMLSASMITNAGGKVLLGALSERFGVRRPAMVYAALIAAGMLFLLHARTATAALLFGALEGLAFSLTTVVPALVTKDVFGQANYRRVFPLVMLTGTLANASFASLIGWSYDAAQSYRPAMLTLVALLALMLLLLLLLYGKKLVESEKRG